MKRVRVILLKEILDGLRDRRSLLGAMIYPLMAPLLSAALLAGIVSQATSDEESSGGEPDVPVIGMELAPTFVKHLDDSGFDPVAWEGGDPADAIVDQSEKVIVRIHPDFPEDFAEGRPARVTIYFDESRTTTWGRVRKVRRAIRSYGASVGSKRLLARGVSPTVAWAIALDEVDLSTPEERGAQLLSLVPASVIVACFLCSLYIAIDTTAGERERGSLESLVLTPASPMELATAKWAASLTFGAIGVAPTAVLSVWACGLVDLASLI